jgi:hypothetical protein
MGLTGFDLYSPPRLAASRAASSCCSAATMFSIIAALPSIASAYDRAVGGTS